MKKNLTILHGLVSRIITTNQKELSSLLLKCWNDIYFLHHSHQYNAEKSVTTFIISKCFQFISSFQSIPDTLGSRFISIGDLDLLLSRFRVNLDPRNFVKVVICGKGWCHHRGELSVFVMAEQSRWTVSLRSSTIDVVWGIRDLWRTQGSNWRISCFWVLQRPER